MDINTFFNYIKMFFVTLYGIIYYTFFPAK